MNVNLGLFLLLLAVSSTHETLYKYARNDLEVNFQEDRLRVDFWGPPQHITLTDAVQDDFVVFFGSDTDRPLDYSCGDPCKIFLEQSSYSPDTVTLSASVKLTAPPPASTGVLQLCIGPRDTFWKRPLVKDTKITCMAWNRSYNPRIGGYLIQPNIHVEDECKLEVYTWYMTKKNYDEMRRANTTDVVIPLFDEPYWLPIVTVFYHGSRDETTKCYFKTPFYTERVSDEAESSKSESYPLVYKYTNYIEALEENSGVYKVSCSGRNWDEFAQRNWNVELSKSLKISFIRGPKVYIEGQSDHTLVLPSLNTSISFNMLVYSTSAVSTFNIERTDGVPTSGGNLIVTSSETHSPFSTVARHRIEVPSVTDEISGTYTVTAVNKERESVTQNIDIIRATDLQVVVSLLQLIVGEGDRVSFDCLVIGTIVESINWTRDFEKLTPSEYNVETEEIGHDHQRGIRLTFLSVRMDYSGMYVCTASNQFQSRRSTVGLAVWPPGSPMITDDRYSSMLTAYHQQAGGHSLNISNHDLQLEWMEQLSKGLSGSSLILAVLTGLVVGVMLLIGVVAGVCYGRQLLLMKNRDTSDEHPITTTPPSDLTAQDVQTNWNLIRKQSLQLDKQTPGELKSRLQEEVEPSQQLKKVFADFDNDHRLSDLVGETVPLLSIEAGEETPVPVQYRSKSKKTKRSKLSKREEILKDKDVTTKKDKDKDATAKKDKDKDATAKKDKDKDVTTKKDKDKDVTTKKEKDKEATTKDKDVTAKKDKDKDEIAKKDKDKDTITKKEKDKDVTAKKEKDKEATTKKEKDKEATTKKEKDEEATTKKERDKEATAKKDKDKDVTTKKEKDTIKKDRTDSKKNGKSSGSRKNERKTDTPS